MKEQKFSGNPNNNERSFLALVQKRQSCRRYSEKPVENEKIDLILESARLAPSASNSQPWTVIVVNDRDKARSVAETTVTKGIPVNHFALNAPVMLVIVVEKAKPVTRFAGWIRNKEFEWTDLGIIAEHICLQAAELDLGTCMVGWFNEKKVKEILSVPDNKRVGLIITLGYPQDGYPLRKKIRKSKSEMARYNKY